MDDFEMDGFCGSWADLDGDGEISTFEMMVEMDEMERMDDYISGRDSDGDDEDDWMSD